MAGESSKVGSLNIETSKTLCQPKIKPEINGAEVTRDSNEVCGLERKECDEIMEHLKNNPGLVIKSLGPEGRIVLHVAVMAGETKKPKPPTSKCTGKGLREAAVDSDWYHALVFGKCKDLMSLLQANPCLLAQTGPEGWTVLHIAATRGCLELLVQVFDLFKDTNQFVDEMSGVKVDWDDLRKAKCGPFKVKAQHLAWFTCPGQFCKGLRWGPHFGRRVLSIQRSSSDAFQHLKDKLVEIMERETSKRAFESLEKFYQSDENYNFVLECKELQFHYACDFVWSKSLGMHYVKTIIDGCLELGPPKSVEVLTYLFQLHNAQGQTLLHVASKNGCLCPLLKLMPTCAGYYECLNAKDVRGWTILHYVAATPLHHDGLEALLKDERIDANAETSPTENLIVNDDDRDVGMTALHLAILHNNVRNVQLLFECPHTYVNALLYRDIEYGYEMIRRGDHSQSNYPKNKLWSPIQLAAIMGLSDVVRAILSMGGDTDDEGKLQNKIIAKRKFQGGRTVLLASASGNPNTLRLFLDHPKFDPLVTLEGATALHYTTNAMIPTIAKIREPKVGQFLYLSDLRHFDCDTPKYEEELKDGKLTPTSYLGRQACITMLLQAGVDIWEKDKHNRLADPGSQALEEAHLWWHEKMARETLEAKKSLNDAANAISIVAALVATASFVGPLQPPLGYGGDSLEGGIQDTHLSIRVFMVSNILSFYLVVASILFAVVPSLPMPQEGIYAEWQRTWRTVSVAIFFLLLSVLGVLISFGANQTQLY